MWTETKRKSITDFEGAIDKPRLVKNDTSIRIIYNIFGKGRSINLSSRLEVAQFLKRHGIICSYAITGEDVLMYIKAFNTTAGHRGVPVMQERLVKITWKDIDFAEFEMIRFAAQHEWEKTVGKVIRLGDQVMKNIKNAI